MNQIKKDETFNSFLEYMKRFFPKLFKKEQDAKKSIPEQLWDILKEGVENDV